MKIQSKILDVLNVIGIDVCHFVFSDIDAYKKTNKNSSQLDSGCVVRIRLNVNHPSQGLPGPWPQSHLYVVGFQDLICISRTEFNLSFVFVSLVFGPCLLF